MLEYNRRCIIIFLLGVVVAVNVSIRHHTRDIPVKTNGTQHKVYAKRCDYDFGKRSTKCVIFDRIDEERHGTGTVVAVCYASGERNSRARVRVAQYTECCWLLRRRRQ